MLYKEVLPNGVRVIVQEMPGVPSVSVGIWAETGSSHECPKLNGVSHFLEHMLFKGTEKRNAKEIANALESVGGQMNAFTTKEYTCFYAKTLKEHFSLSMDVLSDMYLHATIPEEEFIKEKVWFWKKFACMKIALMMSQPIYMRQPFMETILMVGLL